jgi:hypothetical protein
MLSLLERFSYGSLANVRDEDASILRLLHLESFGDRRDMEEKIAEAEAKAGEAVKINE